MLRHKATIHLQLKNELRGRINLEGTELQHVGVNHPLQHVEFVDDKAVEQKPNDVPGDTEMSQILQTAEFVMKMLDVTMPGTLEEEQKKKVFSFFHKIKLDPLIRSNHK